jgi:hypothetical protein
VEFTLYYRGPLKASTSGKPRRSDSVSKSLVCDQQKDAFGRHDYILFHLACEHAW